MRHTTAPMPATPKSPVWQRITPGTKQHHAREPFLSAHGTLLPLGSLTWTEELLRQQSRSLCYCYLWQTKNNSYNPTASWRSKLEGSNLLQTKLILPPVVLWPAMCSPTHPSPARWEAGCWNEKQVRAQEPSTATQLNKQLPRVNVANAEAPRRLCILHTSHTLLLCTSGNTTEHFVHNGFTVVRYLDARWQDSSPAEVGEWSNSFLLKI